MMFPNQLLYGAAYYDEYMPYERLEQDVAMMKKAGINVVRIAESTWSTCEPQEGVFDFSHVTRVIDAMEEAGIAVIIGTPTYAIPTWMVAAHPDVLATTKSGRGIYGPRQIMDITNPVYLFYAERVIRKLMECTAHRKSVIGFQLDNETKYYETAGSNVQHRFVKYLREQFHDDLSKLNDAFGLDYWSNCIHAWEDFPDVRGTINGSLGAEFQKFQRSLVSEFLQWQAEIVNEYRTEDQFITHNFDFDWKGHSYGVQPAVNHFTASKCLTISGTDIYHPTQDALTGREIAFGGDLIRSTKQDNYFVLETQAQGFPQWVPYPGQLRLQAFSHIASGANSVLYWHWHSIHNAAETYWKGLLSHDFAENETYLEAATIGRDFQTFGDHLIHLKKNNRVAIMVSNDSLSALQWFPIGENRTESSYNDVVRWMYDRLYNMNVECDLIPPETERLEGYDLIVIPALYSASDVLLEQLNEYVAQGGHLLATFKSAFTNEHVAVRTEVQPGILSNCFGVQYHQFTIPQQVTISGEQFDLPELEREASLFMELLLPQQAEVLASYVHPHWGQYAAVTRNHYGKGSATYLGCKTSDVLLDSILKNTLEDAGVQLETQYAFPMIIRKGKNQYGAMVRFYLNYSGETQSVAYEFAKGRELCHNRIIQTDDLLEINPWECLIVEEKSN